MFLNNLTTQKTNTYKASTFLKFHLTFNQQTTNDQTNPWKQQNAPTQFQKTGTNSLQPQLKMKYMKNIKDCRKKNHLIEDYRGK